MDSDPLQPSSWMDISKEEPFRSHRWRVIKPFCVVGQRGKRAKTTKQATYRAMYEEIKESEELKMIIANWWIQYIGKCEFWRMGEKEEPYPYNEAALVEANVIPQLYELLCRIWESDCLGESTTRIDKEAIRLLEDEVDIMMIEVAQGARNQSFKEPEAIVKLEEKEVEDFPFFGHCSDNPEIDDVRVEAGLRMASGAPVDDRTGEQSTSNSQNSQKSLINGIEGDLAAVSNKVILDWTQDISTSEDDCRDDSDTVIADQPESFGDAVNGPTITGFPNPHEQVVDVDNPTRDDSTPVFVHPVENSQSSGSDPDQQGYQEAEDNAHKDQSSLNKDGKLSEDGENSSCLLQLEQSGTKQINPILDGTWEDEEDTLVVFQDNSMNVDGIGKVLDELSKDPPTTSITQDSILSLRDESCPEVSVQMAENEPFTAITLSYDREIHQPKELHASNIGSKIQKNDNSDRQTEQDERYTRGPTAMPAPATSVVVSNVEHPALTSSKSLSEGSTDLPGSQVDQRKRRSTVEANSNCTAPQNKRRKRDGPASSPIPGGTLPIIVADNASTLTPTSVAKSNAQRRGQRRQRAEQSRQNLLRGDCITRSTINKLGRANLNAHLEYLRSMKISTPRRSPKRPAVKKVVVQTAQNPGAMGSQLAPMEGRSKRLFKFNFKKFPNVSLQEAPSAIETEHECSIPGLPVQSEDFVVHPAFEGSITPHDDEAAMPMNILSDSSPSALSLTPTPSFSNRGLAEKQQEQQDRSENVTPLGATCSSDDNPALDQPDPRVIIQSTGSQESTLTQLRQKGCRDVQTAPELMECDMEHLTARSIEVDHEGSRSMGVSPGSFSLHQFFEKLDISDGRNPGNDTVACVDDSIIEPQNSTILELAALEIRKHLLPDPKPDPPKTKAPLRNIPIWAKTRQEICESLDYFRSWESGVYYSKGVARGYLLDGFPSIRDLWHDGGRLIISHGGGASGSKAGRKHSSGPTDQKETSPSVSALLTTYRLGLPIAVLVGSECAQFPYVFPPEVGYIVLGYYHIKYAWAERHNIEYQGQVFPVVRFKFAFQWLESEGEPWWLKNCQAIPIQSLLVSEPIGNESHAHLADRPIPSLEIDASEVSGFVSRPPMHRCQPTFTEEVRLIGTQPQKCVECHQLSERVYDWSWMCLNPNCCSFWRGAECSPPRLLNYDIEFLNAPSNNHKNPSIPITPSPPPQVPIANSISSAKFWRGWWCKQCGKLTCRIYWDRWACSNASCSTSVASCVLRIPASTLSQCLGNFDLFTSDYIKTLKRTYQSAGTPIHITTYIVPVYPVATFSKGRRKYSSSRTMTSNASIHVVHGNPLINGEADKIFLDYQNVATSKQFFQRYVSHTGGKAQKVAMYFSQNSGAPYQYIGSTRNTTPFDVAESSVIDALKLIEIRRRLLLPHSKPFNEILTAGYMENQKMTFHCDDEVGLGPVIASLSLGSPCVFEFRKAHREPRETTCLKFVLHHGDVLVMEGPGIQETYQHAAYPMGFRIAATARLIDPIANSAARVSRSSISADPSDPPQSDVGITHLATVGHLHVVP